MCVCVCDPLKEHVVANTVLCIVTVNGRDAPKFKFWSEIGLGDNSITIIIAI